MLRGSVAVVRTRPRAMPLAMINIRKSTHGFSFLSHMSMGLRLAFRPPELRYESEHSVTEQETVLRTFVLIVSAHPYCARKFTCHAMHRARALSTEINNDRVDGIAIALLGFNDLGRSVTPTFSFQKQILFAIISTLSKNEDFICNYQKINVGS